MASAIDLYNLERQLANKGTSSLKVALKNAINSTAGIKTFAALNTANSRAVYKDQRLQRITIQAPHYIFKQNYGFEGSKSNGVNMRLKKTSVIAKALDTSNILNTLADGISEIRLSQVSSLIHFSLNGR
jgi:hypothetical protein